jgi:hypothetical protein
VPGVHDLVRRERQITGRHRGSVFATSDSSDSDTTSFFSGFRELCRQVLADYGSTKEVEGSLE